MIPPIPTAVQAHQLRVVLAVLVTLALTGVLLLRFAFVPHGGADILRLELGTSAAQFKSALLADWVQEAFDPANPQQPHDPVCGMGLDHAAAATEATGSLARVPHFGKLRCNLFVDSVLLVPGYAGLLVYFTLAFAPLRWGTASRHLCCGVALAAGLFDIAENGMTARALDDLLHFVLADATVADVRHASQAKWLLIALACAVLSHLLIWYGAPAGDRLWRRVSAGLMAAATPLLVVGVYVWRSGIDLGMLAMIAALALLTWRQWLLTRPGAVVPD
jgi:hypothetical protein